MGRSKLHFRWQFFVDWKLPRCWKLLEIWLLQLSNRKLFRICLASYKHERGWENSRQLRKTEMKLRVCITVENSHQPPRVFIWCYANMGKHQYLLLFQKTLINDTLMCMHVLLMLTLLVKTRLKGLCNNYLEVGGGGLKTSLTERNIM